MNEEYLVLDTEFSYQKHYNRVGNWKYNKLVAIAVKNKKELFSKYIAEPLENLIIDEDVIVGFNVKVDLLYFWHTKGLQNFFKCGGKVWDCSLAEYILTAQQSKFPSLRDTAVLYGCKERLKLMEQYWDNGVDTCDIPKEIVINDVENDVLDTEKVYLKQIEKAKKQGMYNLIELQNDALLATCECEYNGFKVDVDRLKINKNRLEIEMKIEKQKLLEITTRYWK